MKRKKINKKELKYEIFSSKKKKEFLNNENSELGNV